MDEKYMYLIIGYDFAKKFKEYNLACDEAYEIAEKIITLYKEATKFSQVDTDYYCHFFNFVKLCLEYFGIFKQKK